MSYMSSDLYTTPQSQKKQTIVQLMIKIWNVIVKRFPPYLHRFSTNIPYRFRFSSDFHNVCNVV